MAELSPEWLAIVDWADSENELSGPTRARVLRGPQHKREHDPASYIIGDGEGRGGFQNPINKHATRYFRRIGVDAPAEPIIAWLREKIADAPKDQGRDVSRYFVGPDLPRLVERARTFVKETQ